ncbi:hypothetical protein RI367_000062 [Sorochytrium milnesiophthora]
MAADASIPQSLLAQSVTGDSGLRYQLDLSSKRQTASSLLVCAADDAGSSYIFKTSAPQLPPHDDSGVAAAQDRENPCACSVPAQSVIHELQIHGLLQDHIRAHHDPTLLDTIVAPVDTISGAQLDRLIELALAIPAAPRSGSQDCSGSSGSSLSSFGSHDGDDDDDDGLNSDPLLDLDVTLVFRKYTPLQTSTATPRLQLTQIMHLASDILTALSAVHDAGVVHCDVSLANIVVDHQQDKRPRYCLIDFGLAQSVYEAQNTPVVSGTPGFIAPEVLTPPDSPLPAPALGLPTSSSAISIAPLRHAASSTAAVSLASSWSSVNSLSSYMLTGAGGGASSMICDACHRSTPTSARDIYGFGIVLGLLLSPYLPLCEAELLGSAMCSAQYVRKNIVPRLKVFKSVLRSLYMLDSVVYHAADLLIRMLSYSPRCRISAAAALQHPFVTYAASHPPAAAPSPACWTSEYAVEYWKCSRKYREIRAKMLESRDEWEGCRDRHTDGHVSDEEMFSPIHSTFPDASATGGSTSDLLTPDGCLTRLADPAAPRQPWTLLCRLYSTCSSNSSSNHASPSASTLGLSKLAGGDSIDASELRRTIGFTSSPLASCPCTLAPALSISCADVPLSAPTELPSPAPASQIPAQAIAAVAAAAAASIISSSGQAARQPAAVPNSSTSLCI